MILSVIHRVCNTDNFSLPSYLPTERHSTLSVLNTIFSVHSLQCVIFHAHIHHPIVVTLTAHIEGTTGCITQKFKKSQLPAQQQEGAPQGVHWLTKSATSNTKNGVGLSWAASYKRGMEGAHVGADMP